MLLQKDQVLDRLSSVGNVAQFIALRPSHNALELSYNRVAGRSPNYEFDGIEAALKELLQKSGEKKVNIRSYLPHDPRSREFVYGLETLDEVLAHIQRLSSDGLHLIVNETIDVSDGGVSGVVQGDIIEFSPDDTPRCVEKPGVASLPFDLGMKILSRVYGFLPELKYAEGERTEFSLHPAKRGWRQSHTLLWEHESEIPGSPTAAQRWPNNFSRLIGDKAFGLLMADALGLLVPHTVVVGRRIAPFSFGTRTGSAEVWTRTCPTEPHPGLFTTLKGWTDPFVLFATEDPGGHMIASVLRQDAIPAQHSGAAIVGGDGELIVEGRSGEGDLLMLGIELPEELPENVVAAVKFSYRLISNILGPVRFEWVHDGEKLWIVQLHIGATKSSSTVIVPGEAEVWREFNIEDGLSRLRVLLSELPVSGGVLLCGEVGVTSHVADVLRRAGLPARIKISE